MATKAMIPFLVGMMLLTGVCNTLLTKYQVRTFGAAAPPPPPAVSLFPRRISWSSRLTESRPIARTTNASATAMTPIPRSAPSSNSP